MKLKDLTIANTIFPIPVDGVGIIDITGKVWLSKKTYKEFLKEGELMKVVEPAMEDLYLHIGYPYHRDMPCGVLKD